MSLYSAGGRSIYLGVHEVKHGLVKDKSLFFIFGQILLCTCTKKTQFHRPCYKYIVLHIFAQMLFWANRNQGNHHNFDPSLLPGVPCSVATQETDFHGSIFF